MFEEMLSLSYDFKTFTVPRLSTNESQIQRNFLNVYPKAVQFLLIFKSTRE